MTLSKQKAKSKTRDLKPHVSIDRLNGNKLNPKKLNYPNRDICHAKQTPKARMFTFLKRQSIDTKIQRLK